MIMKKISILFCAALAALAIVSCNKEPKEEPFIEPETQTGSISSTAVSLIKEADPNYWGETVKSAMELFNDIRTLGPGNLMGERVKGDIEGEEEIYTLRDDITAWFQAIEDKDNVRFFLYTVKLSLLKGDITVRDIEQELPPKDSIEPEPEEEEEGYTREFVYTRSNNPLNLVYKFNDKTYKFQFEALDSDNNIIKINEHEDNGYYDEQDVWHADAAYVDITQVAIPTKVALHVTENGASFIDVALYPEVKDLNWDKFINYSDEIHVSASASIPGYSFKATDVKVSLSEVTGKLELFHGNTSMLCLDGKANFDVLALKAGSSLDRDRNARGKRAIPIPINTIQQIFFTCVQKVEGSLKIMGGKVILDGVAYPQDLSQLRSNVGSIYSANDARNADSMIQNYFHVDVRYNNGSKVQSRLIYTPVENEVDPESGTRSWSWTFGMRFADQSFKSLAELEESEDFDAVIGQAAIFMAHGEAIFGVDEEEDAEPLTEPQD